MSTQTTFAPVSVATGAPVRLAMQRLWLTGRILPAGARLIVQHIFRSGEEGPLEVIYAFALPRDAALRRFRITGEGFEVQSELRPSEEAVKVYEAGIAGGQLSALARQYADGLVNLTVGNVRPGETVTVCLEMVAGVELRDDGFRFRFPFTLAPTYGQGARTALVAPGEGEMELAPDQFGDVLLPRFHEDARALHQVGFDLVLDGHFDEIGSPSHGIRVKRERGGKTHVLLAAETDVPDRDLVLDAGYSMPAPLILGGRDAAGQGRFAAIIPSSSFDAASGGGKAVVILLDRSGSMNGKPLEQAVRAIEACLRTLSEQDRFGLVAFNGGVEHFSKELVWGTEAERGRASAWLRGLPAQGGTELLSGCQAAAAIFKGESGDVLVITDGQVNRTADILIAAREAGVRLHCLGIGSASQDRFLALLARETGGLSRFLTPRERLDLAAVELFAALGPPAISGLKAGGNIEPEPPASVRRGSPVLLFGRFEPGDKIELSWNGGQLELPIAADDPDVAETVRLLQGARLITDWECRYPDAEALAPVDQRRSSRIANRLRQLSEEYGLASRELSLMAVVRRTGDQRNALPVTRVVPVGMPQDTKLNAYFGGLSESSGCNITSPLFGGTGIDAEADFAASPTEFSRAASAKEVVAEIAAQMEPDGGMPGADADHRAAASVIALFAFVSYEHTISRKLFWKHIQKLISFLERVSVGEYERSIVDAALALARKGKTPSGAWLEIWSDPEHGWFEISEALARDASPATSPLAQEHALGRPGWGRSSIRSISSPRVVTISAKRLYL